MNRQDLDALIDTQITAWTAVPCLLFRDNERSKEQENATEFMRLTLLDGDAFLNQNTGLIDITGPDAVHGFIVRFDIFTEKNTGTTRASQIGQAVSDYWAYRDFGDVKLDEAEFIRIGEEDNLYHTAVNIGAERFEYLQKRVN